MVAAALVAAACGRDPIPPLATAEPGVVFTYPVDGQLDVPLGTRVVVTFSDPVVASAASALTLEGPTGPVAATAEVTGDGYTIQIAGAALEPGTTYGLVVPQTIAPDARNLPTSGPLVSFTTRTARPRAAAPALVAFNGADPAQPTAMRPMLESTTLRLVFSEPLDPRSVVLGAGALELVEATTRAPVPSTLIANGIHVSIDPIDHLTAGAAYELRVGDRLLDLGGQPVVPRTIALTPQDSRGQAGPIAQVLRTRQAGDPGPARSRAGAVPNEIAIEKPIIGREIAALMPAALAAELGDPKALGGPIAFTIPRGQRMRATGLDVRLGGEIPTGLSTGDILIELVTDGGGRIYRNPHQPASQIPENERAPLYVDLSLDVAVYAVDPKGTAVLTQTVLGVQGAGTVIATDGVLAIETVATMELGLLGVTSAPSNLVLELITDPSASPDVDQTAPQVVATSPALGTAEHAVDTGIEIIFDEPVDLDLARAGGLRLEAGAAVVPSVIESHGAALVIRPLAPLAYSTTYRVVFDNVRDLAGNALAATPPLSFATPRLVATGVPMTVTAVYPGVACALSSGRCAGGNGGDDAYHPFSLPADQPIEIAFSQSPTPSTIAHGTACNTGTVRVEQVDAAGTCVAAVPGTLVRRDRTLSFVPDAPWSEGTRYRLTLVSGGNNSCNAGELCAGGNAASFDPLSGTEGGDGGGPNLVVDFTGEAPSTGTFLFAGTGPSTDVNGSGFIEGGEVLRDENRAAMRIIGTTGAVNSASFNGADCVPGTPEKEACLYIGGAMPVIMGELSTTCPLPDGTTAPSCIPVTMSPQPMYGTSVSMRANVVGVFNLDSDTGTSVMRPREPAGGPLVGYVIDDGGTPTLVVALELYMDAPDMSLPLSSHDLHSKPVSAILRGPMSFLSDGRIVIAASNTADLPLTVRIDAPLGINGTVRMLVPAGEMKLQLVSPSSRGVLR